LETQIIDPEADIVGRMGLLNSLQNQLASAQIDLDILMQTAREGDPRLVQARRRVDVIEQRLAQERARFSTTDGTVNGAYANLIGDYERLSVDKQFAEQAYLSSLASLDLATAEAARKSRYLAAYIEPTLAETPEYPKRLIILATLSAFLIGIWVVATMVYYSIRDRR
jgi:capsular polysaccharide transport system permease protein